MASGGSPLQRQGSSLGVASLCRSGIVVLALSFVAAVAGATGDGIVREPVRFAAGALTAPPAGTLSEAPWPALVPDCTAVYLNASVAAAGPSNTTTVVRVEVPAGRAVSLRECRTSSDGGGSAPGPMRHVRLVLAMGRSSAVALEAWDVAVGGVTIEGPSGNASSVVDALVVVRGGSRVVVGTSAGARASSSRPADDVHVLSVVAPGPTVAVAGFGLVLMEGSVVRAAHDGPGLLYASACAVRAGAAANPQGEASLTVERLRVVITGGSSAEASATHTNSAYDYKQARRAHAATIQALAGAHVTATRVAFAVLAGSTVSAFGDDSSSAAGGIGVNGRRRGTFSIVLTTVAMTHATLIAAGPNTAVRVVTKGDGHGTSAMGVAAAHGRATAVSLSNAAIAAVGPNTTITVRGRRLTVAGGGSGASAMGVAAPSDAEASMTNTTVDAMGPDTSVVVSVTVGDGAGVSAMGVAACDDGSAAMTNVTLRAVGPNVTVAVNVAESAEGASAMGAAASTRGTATMTMAAVYAVGRNTSVRVVTSGHGRGASAMGVASYNRATAYMNTVTLYTAGPDTTVTVHTIGYGGYGASAMGVAAFFAGRASMTNAAVYVVGPDTAVTVNVSGRSGGVGTSVLGVAACNGATTATMTNAIVYAVGPNTTVAVHITDADGRGASAMGVAARYEGSAAMTNVTLFAAGPDTTVAVRITAGGDGAGASAMGVAASDEAKAAMNNVTLDAVGPNTTVVVRVTGGGSGNGASSMGIGLDRSGWLDAAGNNRITRCPGVSVTSEGANDIAVFDQVPHPNVTWGTATSSCKSARVAGPARSARSRGWRQGWDGDRNCVSHPSVRFAVGDQARLVRQRDRYTHPAAAGVTTRSIAQHNAQRS